MTKIHTSRQPLRKVYYCGFFIALVVILTGWWLGNATSLYSTSGQTLAIARLLGLLAAFSILLEVLLISRTPLLEKHFDLFELSDLHRLNGYFMLLATIGHIVFVTVAYDAFQHLGLWSQFWQINSQLEEVLKATIGTGAFLVAVTLSIKLIRKRLPYELWYFIHLVIYGAILLTFTHQIFNGGDFVTQNWFKAFWIVLYLFVFTMLLVYRILRPLINTLRYDFRVAKIVPEANGIHSIFITGKNLSCYYFDGGQFARWRFMASGVWWQAHPYSFSSPPHTNYLRLSFKSDTPYGAKLSGVPIGTRVIIDGPRGAFIPANSQCDKLILVAGGIGVAPFISAIPDLLKAGRQVVLLYAARSESNCAFGQELKTWQQQGLKLRYFISNNNQRITDATLQSCSQSGSDIFICGPDSMSQAFQLSLNNLGHSKNKLTVERFSL